MLPALTGLGYEEMPIASGDNASLAFLSVTFGDVAVEEVARIREELLAYCALDTGGMVRIMERLEEIAR